MALGNFLRKDEKKVLENIYIEHTNPSVWVSRSYSTWGMGSAYGKGRLLDIIKGEGQMMMRDKLVDGKTLQGPMVVLEND